MLLKISRKFDDIATLCRCNYTSVMIFEGMLCVPVGECTQNPSLTLLIWEARGPMVCKRFCIFFGQGRGWVRTLLETVTFPFLP